MKKSRVNIFHLQLFAIALASFNCSTNKNEQLKTIATTDLEIKVPESWTYTSYDGVEKKIELLLSDAGDSIYIDIGSDAVDFDDVVESFSFKTKAHLDSMGINTTELFFSKTPQIDNLQGVHLQEYFWYDTIAGVPAKIMMPKRISNGMIGVHFDSIDTKANKLALYASNLDTPQHFALYKAMQSLRFLKRTD